MNQIDISVVVRAKGVPRSLGRWIFEGLEKRPDGLEGDDLAALAEQIA
jgi:hypothetical protein